MSSKSVAEVAEAVCGTISRWNRSFDVEFLGDANGGSQTWFCLGRKPKQVRVCVTRSELLPMVIVNIEWAVLPHDGIGFQKGSMSAQIDCREKDDAVIKQIELSTLRVLAVFQDVVSGEGLALGKLEADMDRNASFDPDPE